MVQGERPKGVNDCRGFCDDGHSGSLAGIYDGNTHPIVILCTRLTLPQATIYLSRLITHGFPAVGLMVSVFLPLGPCGQVHASNPFCYSRTEASSREAMQSSLL